VANFGAVGSILDFQAIGSSRVNVQANTNQLASGEFATCTVSVDTMGLLAGTYDFSVEIVDSSAANSPQYVDIHVTVIHVTVQGSPVSSSSTYSGSFTGYVQNSDADASDPDGAFIDSYGGPATMTVTPNLGGGYTLQFSATLRTTYPHGEDFSASPNGSVTVGSLTNISFSFTMGDGSCQVQGNLSNGTFSGTWTFIPGDPSNDQSDSGSGSFALYLVV
jgi:hypothetical protein